MSWRFVQVIINKLENGSKLNFNIIEKGFAGIISSYPLDTIKVNLNKFNKIDT
jgi:hypothetical protein